MKWRGSFTTKTCLKKPRTNTNPSTEKDKNCPNALINHLCFWSK